MGRAGGGDGEPPSDSEAEAEALRPARKESSRDDSSRREEGLRTAEERTKEEGTVGPEEEVRSEGRAGRAALPAVTLRGCGAAAGRNKLRCRLAYRALAACRSRAMARPLCVAARASSMLAREGAQRLGPLGGIPVVDTRNRGTFVGRSTGEDGGEDSSEEESKYLS